MERIKEQLSGYPWKLKVGERARMAMEHEYGVTLLVLCRAIGEEISGAFIETYDCRRNDGALLRVYAAELASAEKD